MYKQRKTWSVDDLYINKMSKSGLVFQMYSFLDPVSHQLYLLEHTVTKKLSMGSVCSNNTNDVLYDINQHSLFPWMVSLSEDSLKDIIMLYSPDDQSRVMTYLFFLDKDQSLLISNFSKAKKCLVIDQELYHLIPFKMGSTLPSERLAPEIKAWYQYNSVYEKDGIIAKVVPFLIYYK